MFYTTGKELYVVVVEAQVRQGQARNQGGGAFAPPRNFKNIA